LKLIILFSEILKLPKEKFRKKKIQKESKEANEVFGNKSFVEMESQNKLGN
jgi:hypothetical protein